MVFFLDEGGHNDELFAHASITFKRFSRVIMDLYGVNNVGAKKNFS